MQHAYNQLSDKDSQRKLQAKEVTQLFDAIDKNNWESVETFKKYVNCEDYQGETPLIRAVLRNNIDMVKILVDSGARITFITRYGSALHIAQHLKYEDIVNYLREENTSKRKWRDCLMQRQK